MTHDLNLPITLSVDGVEHAAILVCVQDDGMLFLHVEGLQSLGPSAGAPNLHLHDGQVPDQTLSPLQEAPKESGAWTHLATVVSPTKVHESWLQWLSGLKKTSSSKNTILEQFMSSPTGNDDPFGFNAEDSAETRDIDDGERRSLLAALRDSMSQTTEQTPESSTPRLSEETGDWLDGLGEELVGIEVHSPPPVSEADFEALLSDDSPIVIMEGDEDDWTEDNVNWEHETENNLLEGPSTLAPQETYEPLTDWGGPPEFLDKKDVPDDFEPSMKASNASLPDQNEAPQDAELTPATEEQHSSSLGLDEQTNTADPGRDAPPASFSVPASAEDFALLLERDEPESDSAPSDPRYKKDDKGLHVHWESIEALARDYDAQLSRKRLTIYRDDPPAPGSSMTLWLHIPDAQVLALSARLAGADADRFELRLDLPLVTKGKLKRVARSK